MKYLRIKNKKAEYWKGKEYKVISEIGKKDLLCLLNSAEGEDFEMDTYDEALLPDPSHRIIYKNISEKFNEFIEDKTKFKVEVDKTYHEAISKYSAELVGDENIDSILDSVDDEEEIDPNNIPF